MERYNPVTISSNKKIIIYLFLLIVVVGPFLTLAFFCHPLPGDDFHFAMRALEIGHGGAVIESYLTWTGRYFLCWVLTLRSLLHSSTFAYQLLIFFLILLYPITLYALIRVSLRSIHKRHILLLTLFITFLYFYALPSQNEGLFWFTGAIAYQVPNLLCMAYIIMISLIMNADNKRPIYMSLLVIPAALLIIMIGGCNEISMAVLLLFNLIFVVFQFYNKSGKTPILVFLLLLSLIIAAIVGLAPGNNVRESLFPDRYKISTTIYMTILGAGYYILQWLFMAILLSILSIPIIKQYLPLKNNFFKIQPHISLSVWVLLLAVAFTVPAWATGQMPNPRAINVIFQLFILGWFYNLIILLNYSEERNLDVVILPTNYIIVLIIAIFVLTFSPSRLLNNNIKYAYLDIVSGKALHYSKQMFLYREEVRKSLIPVPFHITETTYSFSDNMEPDKFSVKEMHDYYQLKDRLYKVKP